MDAKITLVKTVLDENVPAGEIVTLIDRATTERVANFAKFLLVCGLFLLVIACIALAGPSLLMGG